MTRPLTLRGFCLLHSAVVHSQLQTVKCLIDLGANINIVEQNKLSPLAIACATQRTDVVDLLLQNGSDPNIQSCGGETPLILAVRTNNLAIVQLLLSAGGDPDLTDLKGHTPLLYSLEVHRSVDTAAVVGALIDGGCQVDHVTRDGATPLMTAVSVGRMDAAELLIAAGADISRVNKQGNNVVFMVLGPRSALYLINRGASCDDVDVSNRRPLDVAVANSDGGMIRLLLSADVSRSAASILEHPRVVKMCEHLPLFRVWLTEELSRPRNLKRLCRQAIRTCLSPGRHKFIDYLPVPRLLKDFLLVKDFDLSSFHSMQSVHSV